MRKNSAPSFGLVVPSSAGDKVADEETLFSLAEAADSSPLEHLWVSDHIVWWHPMYESLTLLAALAARTRRIGLGTAVLLLALRDPVIVAKSLSTIDRLSRQRLTVGVGIGGEFPPEWEAVGVDRRTRAARTDEMITVLRGLWEKSPFGYEGRHISIPEIDLQPKPGRRLPVWIGGRSPGSIRRAARLGDGWMGIFLTPGRTAEAVSDLRRLAEVGGRDPESLTAGMYVWTCIADTTSKAREIASSLLPAFYNVAYERLEKYAVVGSPQECAARFAEYAHAGTENFAVAPIGIPSPEFIAALTEEVMPLVNGAGRQPS